MDKFPSFSSDRKEIHLWFGFYSHWEEYLDDLDRFVSSKDKKAASKYCKEIDAKRLIIRRAWRRILTEEYGKFHGQNWDQAESIYGKPQLLEGGEASSFDLNASSTDIVFIIGFSNFQGLGIDIETPRRPHGVDKLSAVIEYFFTPQEAEKLFFILSFKGYNQFQHDFFMLWTRKEAVIKAWGESVGSFAAITNVISDRLYQKDVQYWIQDYNYEEISAELRKIFNNSSIINQQSKNRLPWYFSVAFPSFKIENSPNISLFSIDPDRIENIISNLNFKKRG